jgi:hypothetical protein
MEPKHTPDPQPSGDESTHAASDSSTDGDAPPVVTTTPEGPEKPLTPSTETQTSATGIVQTITTQVETPTESETDLTVITEATLVTVRPGRCAVHAIRPEYLRDGETFPAGDAFGGIVGAREMIRKGILAVTPKAPKPAEPVVE